MLALLIPFLFAGEAAALWSYVRHKRPDVIYAHWFTPQGVVAALIASLTGVPWVLTSHANDVRRWRKLPGVGWRLVRALLPTASRITAVSRTTLDKMRSFFSEEESLSERVAINPMGGASSPSCRRRRRRPKRSRASAATLAIGSCTSSVGWPRRRASPFSSRRSPV